MSERQEKRKRREAAEQFRRDMRAWENAKPPWWRFLRRRKWREEKPIMPRCLIDRRRGGGADD